jgi:hypothetical protein
MSPTNGHGPDKPRGRPTRSAATPRGRRPTSAAGESRATKTGTTLRSAKRAAPETPGSVETTSSFDRPDLSSAETDHYSEAVLEARLGRRARDILEATVVLEAWTGRPARSAMSAARGLVSIDGPPLRALSSSDPFADSERSSVLAEGLTLVLLIISIAAWAAPIRTHLGPTVLAHAIRVALPLAIAFQWGLRSRYLGRPQGLACLARDGLGIWALMLLVVDAPLALIPRWGPVAAMMVPIFVGGTVLTRRGWGLIYAGVLVVGTLVMGQGVSPDAVLAALTAITLAMCLLAVRSSVQTRTDERAGTIDRALIASVIGGAMGVLLVADPTVSLGVHGAYPAIALLPSVIGCYWGGYYLWNFFDAVPRGMRGVALDRAGRVALSDPAMSIFVGAIVRLVIAETVLSGFVIGLNQLFGGLFHGSDAITVFIAFGSIGTLSMLIGLLESFALQWAALLAALVALAVELAWPGIVPGGAPGLAMAIGATFGVAITLPALLGRLAHSGGTLATTLWIQ